LERRRKDAGMVAGSFDAVIEQLRERWRTEVGEAAHPPLDEAAEARAHDVAERYCAVLDAYVPILRQRDMETSAAARSGLTVGGPRPSAVGILDTLGGGWLARLEHHPDEAGTAALAERMLGWCNEVVDG
jgi:hypothetical protein